MEEAIWAFKNGVEEIYFSYKDIPNHRRKELSVSNLNEALKIINLAYRINKRVSLVYNGDDINYSLDYFNKKIYPIIAVFVSYGLSNIILKDITLIEIIRKLNLKVSITLSSLSLIFNSFSIDFYKNYKINRIILPLHLSPREILVLVNNIRKKRQV